MMRGPMIPHAADDGGGGGGGEGEGGGDDPPATVDKAAHDALVAAHDRLKRDSRADRQELKDLRTKVTTLEGELEEERSKHDDTDKSTALAAQKAAFDSKLTDETAKRDKRIAELEAELNDSAAETALDKALDEYRVKPGLRKAAKAMLRSSVEVEADDGKRVVYMNDLPIEQAVKAWAEGDEGKIFVLDGNAGGGAKGGGKGHAGKNPWKSDQRSLTEQDRIEKQDPALASRLKAEAGVA
jgi:predicted RNase H-like nuclease (RuvC/YqgF family)